MTPEQIRELQKRLKQDREQQKKVALALRRAGKSQEEAAAAVGVAPQTIDEWESSVSIVKIHNTYTPPDLRISVPKSDLDRYAEGNAIVYFQF